MSAAATLSAHRPVSAGGAQPARFASRAFLRAYAVTMRPYLLFVSGATGVAGIALVPGVSSVRAVVLGIVFFLSYGFGQALTDCFQLDTDALSAPYRPLVRGTARRRDVLVVSLAGLCGVGVALIAASPWNAPLVVLSVAGLATYTWFKRRWWAGPLYNAWIVALLVVIGLLAGLEGTAAVAHGTARWSTVGLAGTLTTAFFGYANFVLAGYFKDISADRATGYRTLPVVGGLGISCAVSDGFAGLAVLGAVAAMSAAPGGAVVVPFLAGGVISSLVAQVRLHGVRHESEAHRAIVPVVHAYLLLLAAVAVAHRPDWAVGLTVFTALYFLAMRRRPMRAQV